MESSSVATVPALLGRALAEPGAAAPLTYCDDATGERAELSARDLVGWAARTVGLLRDGCGLRAGDPAAVMLPPHWQTAAVLLGSWAAGLSVSFRLAATAGLAEVGPGANVPLSAVFVARHRLDDWLDPVPDAPHRFALDVGAGPGQRRGPAELPEGVRDYLAEVRRYPDRDQAFGSHRGSDAASVDGTSFREWGNLAQGMAAELGLRAGDRLLVADLATHEHPVKWLLAPFAAGASVVLCANLDPAAVDDRASAERATRVL